jgi:3-polyprenyl-4-hydroxybenzoate decarboxylase
MKKTLGLWLKSGIAVVLGSSGMKYKIKTIDEAEQFRPYEVTLLIESREEHEMFHDKIACQIAKTSQFIGDVYEAGKKTIINSGSVPLK